jgi:ketosteroid isomerase-like protein
LSEASASLDRALVGPDPDAIARHFTEDAVLGESGMEDVIGRAKIRDFLAAGNRVRTVTHHRLFRDELIVVGDRAVELGRFDETKIKLAGGPPIQERGRTVTYWRKEPDGSWRISRLVVSDLPGPGAPS